MDNRLYTIDTHGSFNGITGPISTPINIPFGTVLKLVNMGVDIYEHNPSNTNERVKLTEENVRGASFKTTFASMIKSKIGKTPVVVSTPVVEPEVVEEVTMVTEEPKVVIEPAIEVPEEVESAVVVKDNTKYNGYKNKKHKQLKSDF